MTLRLPKRCMEASPSHARAKVQEKNTAKRLGGKLTTGSGNKDEKGDVRLRKITRIECKTTKNKSFSVSVELLQKLEAACFGAGEIPMFEIELELGKYRLCVLPGDAVDMIVELLEARNEQV